MSSAFIKEVDDLPPEPPPELKISAGPNLVTARGLAAMDAEIERLSQELAAEPGEVEALRVRRDLRYWTARRSTARLTEPPHGSDEVAFGSRVTLTRDHRPAETVELVGEDEADPAHGRVSWISPLGAALIGARAGEEVELETRQPPIEIEVIAVDNG